MKLYPGEQKESTVMNTIKIKGYASRKVNADRIRYTIGFISKDVKASRASEQVKKQCDIFLKDMKDLGFNVSKLHLDGDAIEKEYAMGNSFLLHFVSAGLHYMAVCMLAGTGSTYIMPRILPEEAFEA